MGMKLPSAEDIARWMEEYINSMCRAKRPSDGRKMLRLESWSFDRHTLESMPDGLYNLIPPRVWQWMETEEGAWALENITGIRVAGMMDAATDSIMLSVYAYVDETVHVEHSMRWR